MPDGGSEGEDALGDAGADPVGGLASVASEVELALEGGGDGLDDLAQRFEEPVLVPGFSPSRAGRSILIPAAWRPASNSRP